MSKEQTHTKNWAQQCKRQYEEQVAVDITIGGAYRLHITDNRSIQCH